jgi:DMSO/TMAO reductase YedYZ molybdopterin-dependent catalytic subunit
MRRVLLLLLALTAPQIAMAADLSVKGLVANPLTLSLVALRAYPSVHVTATQATGRGAQALDCTGASVATVLADAQPQYGSAKNARLAHTLLFTADDGYQAALAVAETDVFPGRPAPILAVTCNGRDLDAPRLVVPADAGAGRAVNGVISMELKK